MDYRIEIAAPVGAGKTTVVRTLSEYDFQADCEHFEKHPFLEKFYQDPARYSFETEITFLMQHYHALKDLQPQAGMRGVVCDYSLLLDWTYALVTLQGMERGAFKKLYDTVRAGLRKPDLLVVLECEPAVHLQRIKGRGRPFEAGITPEYLQSLSDTLNAAVASDPDYAGKILRIDTTNMDLRQVFHKHRLAAQIADVLSVPAP